MCGKREKVTERRNVSDFKYSENEDILEVETQ
jgi:hypothetical protein